jgi:hypothetical protein
MRGMLLAILPLLSTTLVHAQANTVKPAYDFSLPREERIKLAESAAPLGYVLIFPVAPISLAPQTGFGPALQPAATLIRQNTTAS